MALREVLLIAILFSCMLAEARSLEPVRSGIGNMIPKGTTELPIRPACSVQSKCLQPGCQKVYEVSPFKANFFEASNICARQGRRMAIVSSHQEEEQLVNTIHKAGHMMDIWIGATDLGERGKFTWTSTGEPITYSNWYVGEPDFTGPYEPCIMLFKHSATATTYRWFNVVCYHKRYFACEYFKNNSTNLDSDIDWKISS